MTESKNEVTLEWKQSRRRGLWSERNDNKTRHKIDFCFYSRNTCAKSSNVTRNQCGKGGQSFTEKPTRQDVFSLWLLLVGQCYNTFIMQVSI